MRVWWGLAGLAIVVLTTVVGCARGEERGGERAASPPECEVTVSPMTTAGAQMFGTPQWLSDAAERIRTLGEGQFPDSFAGLAVRAECERLYVYRVPSGAFDQAISRDPEQRRVVVVDAAHSQRELMNWMARLSAEQSLLGELTIHGYGPDHTGECVTVMASDVAKARAGLANRFPDMPVCVEEGGPATTYRSEAPVW